MRSRRQARAGRFTLHYPRGEGRENYYASHPDEEKNDDIIQTLVGGLPDLDGTYECTPEELYQYWIHNKDFIMSLEGDEEWGFLKGSQPKAYRDFEKPV